MATYDLDSRDHPYTDEEDLVYYNFHSLGKLYFNSGKAEFFRQRRQEKREKEKNEIKKD